MGLLEQMEFHRGDLGGIWEALRPVKQGDAEDAVKWETVSLPHCFNALNEVDPHQTYFRGAGWYRMNLDLNSPYSKGKCFLHFEGAGQKTQVYIGDEKIGEHKGGYDEWRVDISSYQKDRQPLKLSIRCDNIRDLETIPSDLSDFNLYGGLYRPVHLVYEPPIYIEKLTLEPKLSKDLKKGCLMMSGQLSGPPENQDIEILLNVKDPKQKRIETMEIHPQSAYFSKEIPIENPALWEPDNPKLYTLECTLTVDGERSSKSERFGWRNFSFRKKGPFFLNGKRLLLKGTHRHEDHAGVAAAMIKEQIEEEMKLIKAMGANFIRLGHYQQSSQVLHLCDELGILVWEEIPWCRGGLGHDDYKEMGKAMLTAMIEQHRNHPSIILWGLGNENDWPGDFDTFDEEEIRLYMKELRNLSNTLDPSRLTSIRRCEFCKDIPHVYSPSIWAGWYRGTYEEYRESTEKHIDAVDRFLHVEWGADSHAGRYNENPYACLQNLETGTGTDERAGEASFYGGITRASRDGDWSENYACDLFDWTLKEQLSMENLTGTAFWPFKDFSTPLRPENPVPYVNQKGVVERDLTPKETYYVVQSYWASEAMVHLFGHQWHYRWGQEGEEKEFRVYSNCPEVELFLDGVSLGRQKRDPDDFPAAGLRWKAPLNHGEHRLQAITYSGSKTLTDEYSFHYHSKGWNKASKLVNSYSKDMKNRLYWQIQVTDEEGNPCLDYNGRIQFSAAGHSPLIIDQGTAKGSSLVECANGRALIQLNGSAKPAILAATGGDGLFCHTSYPPEEKL